MRFLFCLSAVFCLEGQASASEIDVRTELLSSAAVPTPTREGTDWPRFLGPHGTGVSDETGLLAKWPESGPPVVWKKQIGTGYSAPSVRGNRLVVHHRPRDREIIECLRADTGEELWRTSYPSDFSDPYGYNNGPRCSPLLTDKFCYTYGAEGTLACTELATGKVVWIRSLKQDFQLAEWFFGIGCTPILEDGLLIVLVGGQPNSAVVAFDPKTGKTVWEAVGKQTWDGVEERWPAPRGRGDDGPKRKYTWTGSEMMIGYATPVVDEIHGRRHLLCLVRQGLVSLDPKTGRENFHYWFRSRTHESVNAACPVVIGDKIFISAAYRVGSALLQVAKDGKTATELWRDTDNLQTHWSTTIHRDGFLYGFSGRHENEGELRCLDLKTGNVVWKSNGLLIDPMRITQDPATGKLKDRDTGREIPWPVFGRGSKIAYEDKFIILGERGTLFHAKIDPTKYVELARAGYPEIGYPAWAAPVLSRKRLYLRDENALICLDLAPK
jgi:outer membrane protein assembly factor BamB